MKIRKSIFLLIIIILTYATKSMDETASAVANRNPLLTIRLKQTPVGFYQAHGIPFARFAREELLSVERLDQEIFNYPHRPPPRIPDNQSKELSMTPVKNQDCLGTCTSFAVVACEEYYDPSKRYSEADFTVIAERSDDGKFGLFMGQALVVARDRGFITEEHWLYSDFVNDVLKRAGTTRDELYSSNESVRNAAQAKLDSVDIRQIHKYSDTQLAQIPKFKIGNFFLLRHLSLDQVKSSTLDDIKRIDWKNIHSNITAIMTAHLSIGIPILIVVPVLNKVQWQVGEIDIPSVIDSDSLHSVILSGYSFGKRAFHFKNSWGSWGYGSSGYGWMSFDFIQRYATEIVVANKNSLRLTHLSSRL